MNNKVIRMGVDLARDGDHSAMVVRQGVLINVVHPEIAALITHDEPIQTITIKQPWAWLIVNGYKPVENRDWKTLRRGPTLIHASKEVDLAGYEWVAKHLPEIFGLIPSPHAIEKGGIVGAARLTDCVTNHLSIWFFGKYGFVMDDATVLPFMPLKGQLGFFKTKYTGGRIA